MSLKIQLSKKSTLPASVYIINCYLASHTNILGWGEGRVTNSSQRPRGL